MDEGEPRHAPPQLDAPLGKHRHAGDFLGPNAPSGGHPRLEPFQVGRIGCERQAEGPRHGGRRAIVVRRSQSPRHNQKRAALDGTIQGRHNALFLVSHGQHQLESKPAVSQDRSNELGIPVHDVPQEDLIAHGDETSQDLTMCFRHGSSR